MVIFDFSANLDDFKLAPTSQPFTICFKSNINSTPALFNSSCKAAKTNCCTGYPNASANRAARETLTNFLPLSIAKRCS
jgi:hypothetical protein